MPTTPSGSSMDADWWLVRVVISLAIGMSQADVEGRALATRRYLDVRHVSPTFRGDTIYAESRILGKTPGEVEIETCARNQRGENILSMRRILVVPRRADRDSRLQSNNGTHFSATAERSCDQKEI